MSSKSVYLSLGSNLGDKEGWLKKAFHMLGEIPGVSITGKSSLYRTDPVGYTEQDWFLNAVVGLATEISPLGLLEKTREIENHLGRKRLIRWGPRTIDIDILLYHEEVIALPELMIPHPEMSRRRFVLVPLVEVDENVLVTGLGRAKDLLNVCPDTGNAIIFKAAGNW